MERLTLFFETIKRPSVFENRLAKSPLSQFLDVDQIKALRKISRMMPAITGSFINEANNGGNKFKIEFRKDLLGRKHPTWETLLIHSLIGLPANSQNEYLGVFTELENPISMFVRESKIYASSGRSIENKQDGIAPGVFYVKIADPAAIRPR